jgi:DNA repair protein RadC
MNEVNNPQKAFNCIKPLFEAEVEQVGLITLDSQMKIISKSILFKGTADYCLFHPRDLIRKVCLDNASSFIMAHNHPSGSLQPSIEDLEITQRVLSIAALIQVKFVDHLVINKKSYLSLIKDEKVITLV